MKLVGAFFTTVIFLLGANGVQSQEPTNAENDPSRKTVFASYGLADSEDTVRFLKKLHPGEKPIPGTYKIKARMGLKTQKRSVINDSRELKWPKPESSASPSPSASGWSALGNQYLWNPGSDQNLITFPLIPKQSGGPSITTFNELHIDYEDLYPGASSQLSVEMAVSGKKRDKPILVIGVTGKKMHLSTVDSINVSTAPWKKKGLNYLTSRKLDLPFEPIWHYKQNNGHTFFQRRFHKDLTQIEAIDLIFQNQAYEERIRELITNLRLSFENGDKVMVDGNSLPKHTLVVQGRKVIRIEIGNLIRSKYPNKTKVFLEETIFALPGNPTRIFQENLLHTIEFKSSSSLQTKWVNVLEVVRDHLKPVSALEFRQELLKGKNVSPSQPATSIDQNWSYVQKKKHTVLRQSLHKELSSIEAMDFHLASWVDAASVDIKLRLRLESFLESSKTFSRNSFLTGIYRIEENKVLRLGIGEFLRKQYPINIKNKIKKKIYLESVEIKLPGKINQILQDSVFKRIVFQRLDGIEWDPLDNASEGKKRIDSVVSLPHENIGLPNKKNRLVIKIGNLINNVGWDAEIQSITLRVQPENVDRIGGFHLLGAGMVYRGEEKQPVFFSEGERLSRKWGGPFLNREVQSQTEWVKTLAYIPFQGNKKQKNVLPTYQEITNFAKARISKPPHSSQLKISGITLDATMPFRNWKLGPDGLLLEGTSSEIEMNWPVRGNISRNTRFFLNMAEGGKNIEYLRVISFSGGNPVSSFMGLPNRAISLDGVEGPIDNIKIKMHFKKKPFKVKIKEIALFEPVALSPDQMVEFPRLVWGKTPLIPENIQSSENSQIFNEPGRLTAKIFPHPKETPNLSWTTSVDRKLSWIQRLNITYQSPLRIGFNKLCWLKLTLHGTQNSIDRTICPEKKAGQLDIPIDQLLENETMKANEMIKSISWQILFDESLKLKQLPLTLELGMSLEGMDYISLREELPHYPVLEMAGQSLYPTAIPTKTRFQMPFELNMGQTVFTRLASSQSEIRFPKHPYLEVTSIILKKSKPLSRQEWLPLVAGYETQKASPWFSMLTKFLSALLVLWIIFLGKQRGWLTALWIRIKNRTAILRPTVQTSLSQLAKHLKIKWTFLNRVIGLLILGPGIFLTSYLVQTNIRLVVFRTLMILLTAVLWHELRHWVSRQKTSDHRLANETPALLRNWFLGGRKSKTIPPFLFSVSLIALGWSAWALGSFQDFLLNLCPLLGIIYFFLPWLFQNQTRTWITAATILYGLGIIASPLKWWVAEDLFLSFAAVFAVLVWRNLIRSIKPVIELHHPELTTVVYRGPGSPYIAGFLVTLVLAAFFLIVRLEPIAEQIAVVGYYMLVIGVFLEARSLLKNNREHNGENKVIATGEEASRA